MTSLPSAKAKKAAAKPAAKKAAAKPAAKKAAARRAHSISGEDETFKRTRSNVNIEKAVPSHAGGGAVKSKASPELGYVNSPSGIQIPMEYEKIVKPPADLSFTSKVKDSINNSINNLLAAVSDGYEVSEIELSLSFDAKGSFLGFGVGGATSVKIKIKPKSN